MKFFKHLTASGNDPDIGKLIDEMGLKGYYLFFRTLEIMSSEYNITNPGQNSFKFCWFLDQFSRKIRNEDLKKFLKITTENGRIIAEYEGRTVHLNCPKLRYLTDEYTRQKPYRIQEKVTEKVTSEVTEKVTPKIKDIRIKIEDKNIYSIEFEEFWEIYPRKIAKKKAFKGWSRLSKKQMEEVLSAVPNYVKEIEILQTETQFIKHPTTLLNPENELWVDFLPDAWKPPKQSCEHRPSQVGTSTSPSIWKDHGLTREQWDVAMVMYHKQKKDTPGLMVPEFIKTWKEKEI